MFPIDILKVKLRKYKKVIEKLTPEELILTIEEVEQTVKNYCNRDNIPPDLNFVVAEIAKDLILFEYRKAQDEEDELITSNSKIIKVGRVEIQRGSNTDIDVDINAHKANLDDLLLNYREQLNRFRILRW